MTDAVQHVLPVYRDMAAYLPILPDGTTRLTRSDIREMMKSVARKPDRFIAAVKAGLSSSSEPLLADHSQDLRHVSDVTERIDFPMYKIRLAALDAWMQFRTCLTACAHSSSRPGRHKIWSRAVLVRDTNGPAPAVDVQTVIEFYKSAQAACENVRLLLWSEFAAFAATQFAGLKYDEDGMQQIKIELDESADSDARLATEKLRRGSTLKGMLDDDGNPGTRVFTDMFRILERDPGIDPREIKVRIAAKDIEVRSYRLAAYPEPFYFVQKTTHFEHSPEKIREIHISGTGFATGPFDATSGDVRGRFAFMASRDLMLLRGGEI